MRRWDSWSSGPSSRSFIPSAAARQADMSLQSQSASYLMVLLPAIHDKPNKVWAADLLMRCHERPQVRRACSCRKMIVSRTHCPWDGV